MANLDKKQRYILSMIGMGVGTIWLLGVIFGWTFITVVGWSQYLQAPSFMGQFLFGLLIQTGLSGAAIYFGYKEFKNH
jgi:hypothetical protein